MEIRDLKINKGLSGATCGCPFCRFYATARKGWHESGRAAQLGWKVRSEVWDHIKAEHSEQDNT